MNSKNPKQIAIQFNDCITRQAIIRLAEPMTDDHTFIDRDGNVSKPKAVMIEGWKNFFGMCPKYKNTFTRVEMNDDLVVIPGYAYWSEEQPYDPVIWTAAIVNDLVAEWRIYYYTPENRAALNLT